MKIVAVICTKQIIFSSSIIIDNTISVVVTFLPAILYKIQDPGSKENIYETTFLFAWAWV